LAVTPLTGIVTPFLSYGGSAMVANFAALGILVAIDVAHDASDRFDPFRLPMKCLAGVFGAFAVALTAIVINIAVLHDNDYAVRPHLGIQADGGRRFEYNPRVLDIVRLLPRGTVYDRAGVPLASEDSNVIARAQKIYEGLGVSLAEACPHAGER